MDFDGWATPKLRELYLNNNFLTSVPAFKSDGLEIFNLHSNSITSVEIDEWITPKLRELYLNNNFLTSVPAFKSDGLEIFNLRSNMTREEIDGWPTRPHLPTPKLRKLYQNNNLLTSVPAMKRNSIRYGRTSTVIHLNDNKIVALSQESFRPILDRMSNISTEDGILDISGLLGESGIAAVSAAAISFVALVASSISYYRFRKEKARNIALSNEETERFLKGQPGSLNSAMGLSEQAHLLPLDKQWDFPPEKLKLGKMLGSGQFGYVLKAVAIGIRPPEPETTVAVKKRKSHSSLENYQALMMEVKIMSHLGMHLNVVNFLGACTKDLAHGNLMMIVEYCPFGSLDKYLRANKDYFNDQIDPHINKMEDNIGKKQHLESLAGSGGTNSGSQVDLAVSDTRIPSSNKNALRKSSEECVLSRRFTTGNLVSWAYQIAQGMEYLGCRKGEEYFLLLNDLTHSHSWVELEGKRQYGEYGIAEK
ncbi:unnamed protein product [Darwinula stevensoni]|uniref:Protein kinase domain-containing protein n=1 Tax=Darwinula stevensoni TaxID=69355 RepID=A0A7R9FRR1_9CRUS|nr:unnamed protein product [Darwinula stevensoni]CAG0901481.1 unnamed protein product [Darwinula stevensoni]